MSIPPAEMLLYAAVVREGGFTRAARALGLTKQTVSERVGKLEERLGVRLLERTTRRLRPTDAGSLYYERCAAIAAQIEEANAEIQRRQAAPVGWIRLSAPVLYGRRFLSPVIADYLRRFPEVRVEVVLADRRVDLISEGFDLAIRIGALDDSTLTARKLGEGHVYHVASPAWLKAHRISAPQDLGSLRTIGMRAHETWRLDGASVKVTPSLVVNDLEMATDAATAGLGAARLPSLVCREAVESGALRVLFGPDPAERPPVYAVYPSRDYLPAKIRLLIEALATLVQPMAPLRVTRRHRA